MKLNHVTLEPGEELTISFEGLWSSCDISVKFADTRRSVKIGRGLYTAPQTILVDHPTETQKD